MKKDNEMKTDFERLRAMADDDIDCSDFPALTDEELASPEWFGKRPDQEIFTFSIDRPVLEFFQKQGRGYRERINSVLKEYVAANA
jgi:uncharacterized protein (DUF4415 family)